MRCGEYQKNFLIMVKTISVNPEKNCKTTRASSFSELAATPIVVHIKINPEKEEEDEEENINRCLYQVYK